MRLVDREQGDAVAGMGALEQVQEAPGQEPLRGDVQQVEVAGQQVALDLGRGTGVEAGIEARRADAELA